MSTGRFGIVFTKLAEAIQEEAGRGAESIEGVICDSIEIDALRLFATEMAEPEVLLYTRA